MCYPRRPRTITLFCTLLALLFTIAQVATALADSPAGSIKGTVSATNGDINAQQTLLAGARLTLTNLDVPDKTFKATTDEAGNFIFTDLP
nr:carboxypeptidase-like regulatory domain-containing protein [Acidobacteriota bacterium]